jgi:sugar lactone lactonase YvrE
MLRSSSVTLVVFRCQNPANRGRAQAARQRRTRQGKSRLFAAMAGLMIFFALTLLCLPAFSQANNTINTVAGGGPLPTTPSQADIPGPTSVAEDAAGNIYVSPPNSYYVFEWQHSTNTMSIFAGIGIQGGGGDGGLATKAELLGPAALALDGSGNVYIADGNKIRCVAAVAGACGGVSVGQIKTIAGLRGQCSPAWGVCGDGGPAVDAQLAFPQALFIDSSSNIYVADTYDNRIRFISSSSGIITTVAGVGHICTGPHFVCGDGGPATQAWLDLPGGVAVDGAGNIFIGDTRDERIRYVDKSTGNISTTIGSGSYCQQPTGSCGDGGALLKAQFHYPAGLALDPSGNLYIADSLDYKIRFVTFGSTPSISTVAGNGVQGFSGDGGTPLNAELDVPLTVILDSSGNLTMADSGNQRVRQIAGGHINTIAGGGSGGDGGAPTSAMLANSITVAWDATGTNFYIADAANNRIRQVTPGSSGVISTVAGTGQMGRTGDGGAATAANLNAPGGVAIDSAHDIFIADTGNQVIREVNGSTGVITTIAGSGNSCDPRTGSCGDGGPATKADLTSPTSVAVDGNGNLYIADQYTCRVREVNTAGIISTLAGTGKCNFSGDNGPANKADLNFPYGVAADAAGNVYIADSKNNRIRCVVGASGGCGGSKAAVGTIITYAFNGFANFKGDGGPALKAAMTDPLEVSLDPSGNLFVAGGPYQVVRRIDAASQTVATVAGNPKSGGFGGDGGPATQAALDNLGLSVNGAQQLLVADTGNNRIRQVDMVPAVVRTPSLNFGNVTVGQTSPPMPAKVKNTGLADLPISNYQIVGQNPKDFAISNNGCGSHLAPDITCSINITFTPHAKGARVATLKITDSVGTQSVKLTGTGQ